jgi:hypothetical protein
MTLPRARAVFVVVLGLAFTLPATAGQASAGPEDHGVRQVGTMTIPGGNSTAFDISWVDQATGQYFLSDESNRAVDWFSATTDRFVRSLAQPRCAPTPRGPRSCAGRRRTRQSARP